MDDNTGLAPEIGERVALKYTPDQPRVPAGSSDGGQWTSEGGGGVAESADASEGEPQLIPAFAPPAAAKAVEAALSYFVFLSGGNTDQATAVLEFSAQEFAPGTSKTAEAIRVVRLSRDQVDAACPRHGEVQSLTDEAADTVRREGNYSGATSYGTKVHKALKDRVGVMADPNFRAEVSAIKSGAAGYGTRGSIRVDVLENVGDGTVCVYDIKTGRRGSIYLTYRAY